jgi:hypothetical protein
VQYLAINIGLKENYLFLIWCTPATNANPPMAKAAALQSPSCLGFLLGTVNKDSTCIHWGTCSHLVFSINPTKLAQRRTIISIAVLRKKVSFCHTTPISFLHFNIQLYTSFQFTLLPPFCCIIPSSIWLSKHLSIRCIEAYIEGQSELESSMVAKRRTVLQFPLLLAVTVRDWKELFQAFQWEM